MKRIIAGLSTLFHELRRRHVFRVVVAYAVMAFAVMQVATAFFPPLNLPDWTLSLVAVLLVMGFPVAAVLAWAYDITPAGIRRTAARQSPVGKSALSAEEVTISKGGVAGGRYEILDRLSAGAMGVVYRARDTRLERPVALKFLHSLESDDTATARFLQEARAAAALTHPNITTLHGIEEDAGRPFLVMELVDGETLQARLERMDRLQPDEAVSIAIQVAAGLEAAHARGIVHRDIKPANLMISRPGLIKIMDFGIARVPGSPAMTRAGSTLGSAAYMSPEQVRGDAVDGRSDVWALGVVLYEMLSGRLPFRGDNEHTVLHGVLHVQPAPVHRLRPEAPLWVSKLVDQALAKDPSQRLASASVMLAALRHGAGATDPAVLRAGPPRGRRLAPAVVSILALVLILSGAAAAFVAQREWTDRRARADVSPQVESLIQKQQFLDAFLLAQEGLRRQPGDPRLIALAEASSMPTSARSTPPGAYLEYKAYLSPDAAWTAVGHTPLDSIRLPATQLRWRMTLNGYSPEEGSMTPWLDQLDVTLTPVGEAREGMVRVPAGSLRLGTRLIHLPAFWVDRFEVTNREYARFVEAGGYGRSDLWQSTVAGSAPGLELGRVRIAFRDRTGRPGPAGWSLSSYPKGADDLPVAGISWYEAAAYCAVVGKSLPTMYHWYRAAHPSAFSDILVLSNFSGDVAPVGRFPGVGPFGTYDMAGNVKEWVWNGSGDLRQLMGGAWNEPEYLFTAADGRQAIERPLNAGVRCTFHEEPVDDEILQLSESLHYDFSRDQPANDALFAAYLSPFAYDAQPLHTRRESGEERVSWHRETVSFNAAYGNERVLVHVFLPAQATPPYKTVVYFPGSAAFQLRSSANLAEFELVDFILRSGRALVYPVYKGMYERRSPEPGPMGPAQRRSRRHQWSQDLGRTLDYLETRDDIELGSLAYFGLSTGAMWGPIFAAVDQRLKVLVLMGGGIQTSEVELAEVSPLHFAPRVHAPALMIAGRDDFLRPIKTAQEPLFRLLGTPPEHKRLAILDGGHIPEWNDVIRETLDWLDRYQGPVPLSTRGSSRDTPGRR
jgi:eukaryotic-like serine/threonine-protein kinase